MRHRIFIAINLPEEIKKKLADYQSKWPELPIRWTKKENLHITLFFLGYLNDEELLEICKITKEAASRNELFSINLNKIYYGPPKKMPPRMVWVEGEKSKELGKLQKDLESSVLSPQAKITDYNPPTTRGAQTKVWEGGGRVGVPLKRASEPEARPYAPHITLGRIKTWEWRQIEPEERPEVNEEINLSFEVNSIDLMESQLKRGGSEYTILETCNLKPET